jgi:hypothetical protein
MTQAKPELTTTSSETKTLPTTATFISGVAANGQSMVGVSMPLQPWRTSILSRSVRTTDYFMKDQQRLAQTVQEDLSAVQSFLSNCQYLSPLQALQFALVRAAG